MSHSSARRGLLVALVVAGTVSFTGFAAVADPIPAPPDSPGPLSTTTTNGTLSIGWQRPAEHGAPVTGYEVDRSSDDETTWTVLATPTVTSVDVAAPPAGSIFYYRVIADSDAGPSDPDVIGVETPGTRTQRFKIVTQSGGPVTGENTIRWSDGYGTWSKELDLSPDGIVSIPDVSATSGALLRLTEGRLPGGNLVASKEWSVDLGTDTQTLAIPDAPAMTRRTVHLAMPDGTPVGGAEIDGDWYALVENTEQDGYTYSYEDSNGSTPDRVRTAADGSATIEGWPTEDVDWIDPPPTWPHEAVLVVYDDGILQQAGDFPLTGDDTSITLNPMPYLSTEQPATTAAGHVGAVDFVVHPAPSETVSARPATSLATTASASALAGVHVSLKPPTGWTSKRCADRSALTGVSDSHGRVRLRVCGAMSGSFAVKSSGAVGTAAVSMRVWHGAPAAPTAMTATSKAKGAVTVTWSPPSYTGGAAVSGYVLTLTARGQKTHTTTLPADTRSRSITGLTRAVSWTASLRAVTKYHAGTSSVRRAWVG